jgi:hypothetical protein
VAVKIREENHERDVARSAARRPARVRAKRLAQAARKVRDESMRVNAEFDAIEQDPAPD